MDSAQRTLLGKELYRPVDGDDDSDSSESKLFLNVSEALESLNHSRDEIGRTIEAVKHEEYDPSLCYDIGCFGYKKLCCDFDFEPDPPDHETNASKKAFYSCVSLLSFPLWFTPSLFFLFSDTVCCRAPKSSISKWKIRQLEKEKSEIEKTISRLSRFNDEEEIHPKHISGIFQYQSPESIKQFNFSQLRQIPRAELFNLIEEKSISRDQLTYWHKVMNFRDLPFDEKVNTFENEGLIRLFLNVPGLLEEFLCQIPLYCFKDKTLKAIILSILNRKLEKDVELNNVEFINFIRRVHRGEEIEDILIVYDTSFCVDGNEILANKAALSKISPDLESILSSRYGESVLKDIILFSQTGELDLSLDNLEQLLEFAHENQIESISRECEYFINDLMIKGASKELISILQNLISIPLCQRFLMDYFSEQLGQIDPLVHETKFRDLIALIFECALFPYFNKKIEEIFSKSLDSWFLKQRFSKDDHKTAREFMIYCDLWVLIKFPPSIGKKIGKCFSLLCRMKFSFIKHVWNEANEQKNMSIIKLVRKYCHNSDHKNIVEQAWIKVPEELRPPRLTGKSPG